jgi:PKD repeat protein
MNAQYTNYPIQSTKYWRSQKPEHGSWRVEVEPTGADYPQNYNTFLHVLDVEDQETSNSVTSQLIESNSGDAMQGSFIQGTPHKVAMFARSPEQITSTSFTIPASGETDLLILDLVENTNYYYKRNGQNIEISTSDNGGFTRQSSAQGTIFLRIATSDNYVLCRHDSNTGADDCPVHAPNYPAKPDKGDSIVDTNFYTTITRVTDTVAEVDNYNPTNRGLSPYYSTANSENSTGTYLLVIDHTNAAGWHLYDVSTLEHLERLTDLNTNSDGWPRWDAIDPNIFYFTSGASMYKYDVSKSLGSRITLVHDFTDEYPSATTVDWRDEGTPSEDTRYWGLCAIWGGSQHYIFSYDKTTDTVLGQVDVSDYSGTVDWVAISPSGDYLVARWSYYSQDLWRWNKDGTGALALTGNIGHSAPAKKANGEDVWIYFDEDNNNWITMVDIQGNKTKLVKYYRGCSNAGGHFNGSNYNKPGWALLMTMCNDIDGQTVWMDAKIIAIELVENPTTWILSNHNAPFVTYWSCPFANFNRDGTRVYFGSNWGADDDTQNDVYRIDLSKTWWTELSGPVEGEPDNIPPTASASATPINGSVPLTVSFTGFGTDIDGKLVSYSWDFGDGSTSSQQSPSHTYSSAGSYTASLTVTDGQGAASSTSLTISVSGGVDSAPTAPKSLRIIDQTPPAQE